jgi:CTP:molybdopterin cytidylyltransferase MocA
MPEPDASSEPQLTVLQMAKAEKNYTSLYLVKDDVIAKRMLAAWLRSDAKCQDRSLGTGESIAMGLEAVWGSCSVDVTKLADMVGITIHTAQDVIYKLQMARLIFPDGTVNDQARSIVDNEVGSYLKNLINK